MPVVLKSAVFRRRTLHWRDGYGIQRPSGTRPSVSFGSPCSATAAVVGSAQAADSARTRAAFCALAAKHQARFWASTRYHRRRGGSRAAWRRPFPGCSNGASRRPGSTAPCLISTSQR